MTPPSLTTLRAWIASHRQMFPRAHLDGTPNGLWQHENEILDLIEELMREVGKC